MSRQIKHFYDFGRFRLDAPARVLLCDGEMEMLTQKAFDVLLVLVEQRGRIVEKDELMRRVWPDTFVEESNLAHQIYTLRKALGKAADGKEYIQTVPRRGYRFVAEVNETRDEIDRAAEVESAPALAPEEFARSENRQVEPHPPEPRPQARSGETIPSGQIKRNAKFAAFGFFLLVVVVGAAIWRFGVKIFGNFSNTSSGRITITSLPNTSDVACAAISPDGSYVAFAQADKPQSSSLWITQLGAFTSQVIIPPAEVEYRALSFSPDGHYIYYVADVVEEGAFSRYTLYRVSMLGGPSKKLLEGVNSPVSFSPDGSRFVFERLFDQRRESALIVASSDGGGQQEIATIRYPERFLNPVWSPDGKIIASAAGQDAGGRSMYVTAVSVGDWKVREASAQRWRWIGQLAWLPGSEGMLMVASDQPETPFQVWQMDYPDGAARRVTNDLNFYDRLSASADSESLAVRQRQLQTSVWLIPRDDSSKAKQITPVAGNYTKGIVWTPDGKIVCSAEAGNLTTISMMNADGSQSKQLLGDLTGRAFVSNAHVCPNGRYIVYTSDLTGARQIWRMNLDGGDPVQLTNGDGEDDAVCSPDGRSVVYMTISAHKPALWKVSIDGGQPERLTEAITAYPAISPDGKLIASFYSEPGPESDWKLAVFRFEGGPPLKVFPQPVRSPNLVSWTPDGRHLTYADNPIGPASVWLQPIEGGPPKQLAEFETDRVFGFDWSPDGKQLACVRGRWAGNIVLMRDFKQ